VINADSRPALKLRLEDQKQAMDLAEMDQLFKNDFETLESCAAIPTYSERDGRETLCLMRKK
jgi:hypothetical protein